MVATRWNLKSLNIMNISAIGNSLVSLTFTNCLLNTCANC